MLSNKPVRKYMVTARRMEPRGWDAHGARNFVQSSEQIAEIDVDSMGRRTVAWVIERIVRKEASFFMYVGLERVVLRVVDQGSTPRLRAICETENRDHLLTLPLFT